MLDYRGLEALSLVVEEQSYERAADSLCISQPAVSQRIKALQEQYSEPLMYRDSGYKLTPLGERLVAHYKKVYYLEQGVQKDLVDLGVERELTIAMSRDILDTWFLDVLQETNSKSLHKINIVTDDQDLTHSYVQKGRALCSLGTIEKTIPGCEVKYLGEMHYILVATPKFWSQHDNMKNTEKRLPILQFDVNDSLNEKYFSKFFPQKKYSLGKILMPSVKGFKHIVLQDKCCALIPSIDIKQELERGALVCKFPEKVWCMPIFFTYCAIDDAGYKKIIRLIIETSKKYLI